MNDQQDLQRVLSADAATLYRRVLRSGGTGLSELADELDWHPARLRPALTELEGLRLVTVSEGQVRPRDPRVGIGRLVDRIDADMDQGRQHLASLRASLEGFETDYRRGQELRRHRTPLLEEVSADVAPEVVVALIRTSTGPIRQVSSRARVGPMHDPAVVGHRQELLRSGRELRTVFHPAVLEEPQWRGYVEARAGEGERQRFLDEITTQFAVFGRSCVIVDQGEHREAPALLIRAPAVVEVFTLLFEELWRHGEPAPSGDPTAVTYRLMELLAMGFKDEAIARHLGLGVRTVRRRISTLMQEQGVETRFQLGLAIGRRALID